MPPAGFEPTASGLGILRSILLSYGGSRNISYLQLRFSYSVSNCSPLFLTVSNEVSKSLIVAYLLNFRKEMKLHASLIVGRAFTSEPRAIFGDRSSCSRY